MSKHIDGTSPRELATIPTSEGAVNPTVTFLNHDSNGDTIPNETPTEAPASVITPNFPMYAIGVYSNFTKKIVSGEIYLSAKAAFEALDSFETAELTNSDPTKRPFEDTEARGHMYVIFELLNNGWSEWQGGSYHVYVRRYWDAEKRAYAYDEAELDARKRLGAALKAYRDKMIQIRAHADKILQS